MSVIRHRIVASAILICGGLTMVAVGRTMVRDSTAIARVRHQLDGRWVGVRLQAAACNVATGAAAARSTVEFAGSVVKFTDLIAGDDSTGTYVIDPMAHAGEIDFKLDAGWMRGIYQIEGDRLTLCVNAIRLIEQLGVPTRGYPATMEQSPGRYVYVFEKATP